MKTIESFGKKTFILQSGSYSQFLGVVRASFDFDTKKLEILNLKKYQDRKKQIASRKPPKTRNNYNPLPKSKFYLDSLLKYQRNGLYNLIPAKDFPVHIPITTVIPKDENFSKNYVEKYKSLLNQYFLKPVLGYEYDSNIISLESFKTQLKRPKIGGKLISHPRRSDFAELMYEIIMNESCLKLLPQNSSICTCQHPAMV